MTVAVGVVPVPVAVLLAVDVVAVARRCIVRSAVVGPVVVAAAQQQAGGGQHDENLGGTRNSQSHHFLPCGPRASLRRAPRPRPPAALVFRSDTPRHAAPSTRQIPVATSPPLIPVLHTRTHTTAPPE